MADAVGAARLVAARFRAEAAAGMDGAWISKGEAAAILPLLDAAAAGPGDDKVERWARPIFTILAKAEGAQSTFDDCLQVIKDGREGEYPHRMHWFGIVMDQARATIALADAERAAVNDALLSTLDGFVLGASDSEDVFDRLLAKIAELKMGRPSTEAPK